MTQPWTPPVGNNWTPVTLLKRIGLGHDMTLPEGDQNKTDAENAINWLGNRIFDIINGNAGFATGDVKITYRNAVQSGWLLCDHRTMGTVASNAQITGQTYFDLYVWIWQFATDDDILTSGGVPTTKGASAADDWNANKRLYLPDMRGRVICGTGLGPGLTNRILGDKFGVQAANLQHDHGVSTIVVAPHDTTLNLTGNITINAFTGSVTPTAIVSIDPIPYSFSPTATVSIDPISYNIPITGSVSLSAYTPGGSITINSITVDFSNADNHTGVITEDAPGHRHSVSIPAMVQKFTGDTDFPAQPGVYNTTDFQVQITIDLPHAGTQLITPTGSFNGSASTQTGSFSGNNATGVLNATGTVTVDPLTGNLNATGSVTVNPVSITHTHTGSVSIAPYELILTHSVSGHTDVSSPTYSTLQPTIAVNFIIKI